MRQKKDWHISAIGNIHQEIEKSKRKLADLLSRRTDRFAIEHKKLALAAFVLLIASACILLVTRPIRKQDTTFQKPPDIKSLEIHLPVDPEIQKSHSSMLKIKSLMDSLKYSKDGRNQYEQIMSKRPGLVDSVEFLLREYE